MPSYTGQFTERVSAKGKVMAVTGCESGIGLETVKELNLRGAKVYMLCRKKKRAETAKKELVKAGCNSSRLILLGLDLSSFESVRKCAALLTDLEPRLDVLVNNACVCLKEFKQTIDGHEATWQVNHLGPFLLTQLLIPLIGKSPEGRIVIVASDSHSLSSKLDVHTISSEVGFSGGIEAYNKSKLANVMYTRELARRLEMRGQTITVNCLNPGVATESDSRFSRQKASNSVRGASKSPKDGAQTSLYLALSTEVKGVSGGYYSDCKRANESSLVNDYSACDQLYEYSRKVVGLT